MLVLSRKAKERIFIGENIELVIIEVKGGKVRLGFNAPSDVQIHREEVYHRIQSATGAAPADRCGSRTHGIQPRITARF